jgi:hypothetical protein
MPYLQAATNNYFGFMPVREGGAKTGMYTVSSSETSDIAIGDIVVPTSLGTAKVAPAGGLATGGILGVAASFLTAGTGLKTNPTTTQQVLVYDDPMQIFVGCDTTSGVYGPINTSGGMFNSVAVATTGCVGSTGVSPSLKRSVMALSGVLTTIARDAGVFKVIGMHPIENNLASSASPRGTCTSSGVRKWLLQPTTHVLGLGTSGALSS